MAKLDLAYPGGVAALGRTRSRPPTGDRGPSGDLTGGRRRASAAGHVGAGRAVACLLTAAELPVLRERLEGDPTLALSAACFLDGPPAGGRRAAARGGGRGQVEGATVFSRPAEFVAAVDADVVVVSDDRRLIKRDAAWAVVDLALRGAAVYRLSEFLAAPEGAAARPSSSVPDPEVVRHLLAALDGDSRGRWAKRVLDVVLGGLLLVFAAPLMLLIAAAIKLDSPGPVFFAQERLGRLRAPFRCLKFRTMCEDAERLTGPVWASAGDARITRVGRILRKSRLDELPQLINVVRGEMSLVGARPIRRYFADLLAAMVPFYDLRFLEKPGLTGWAQVKYGYSGSVAEQVEKFFYDYYYIRRRSNFLDLYIMVLTLWVVVRMRGA